MILITVPINFYLIYINTECDDLLANDFVEDEKLLESVYIPLVEWLKKDRDGTSPVPDKVLRYIREYFEPSLDRSRKSAAAKALKRSGKPAVPRLIEAFKHGDLFVSSDAAKVLGIIEDESAIKPLIDGLSNGNASSAAYALANFRDTRAVKPLLATLKDNSPLCRAASAYALGRIKDTNAVLPLIDSLKDSDKEVRAAATYALGNLQNERAIVPLRNAFKNASERKIADHSLRLGMIYAVGIIGGAHAAVLLIEAINDSGENTEAKKVRSCAAEGLRKLKSDSSLPFKLITEGSLTAEERIITFEALRQKRYISIKAIDVYCQSLLDHNDLSESVKIEVRIVLDKVQNLSQKTSLVRASEANEELTKAELLRSSQSTEDNVNPEEHLRVSESPDEETKSNQSLWKRIFKRT